MAGWISSIASRRSQNSSFVRLQSWPSSQFFWAPAVFRTFGASQRISALEPFAVGSRLTQTVVERDDRLDLRCGLLVTGRERQQKVQLVGDPTAERDEAVNVGRRRCRQVERNQLAEAIDHLDDRTDAVEPEPAVGRNRDGR